MNELSANKAQYNNCFVLGGRSKNKDGKPVKVPMFIDKSGEPAKLRGGKAGPLCGLYALTYEQARRTLNAYLNGGKRVKGDESLRVSLYLDNAMYGNLHIFVIDFDSFDEQSGFFQSAKNLADKVTRSQGGGYHMFYGIDKNAATPLFDSINLLASDSAKSYVRNLGAVTLDGTNKVDLFCDARHFIYEWEEWDNTAGLTDKTQSLYELIRDNFSMKRPMDVGGHGTRSRAGSNRAVLLDEMDELDLLPRMSDVQKEVFADLKTISSDCTRGEWFSIGLNIWHVFGDNLGGDVFRFWSEPGQKKKQYLCISSSTSWKTVL